ncbi:hypothetical protein [Streptomyces sp. NPDC058678]
MTAAHALLQQLRKISHPLLLPAPDPFIHLLARFRMLGLLVTEMRQVPSS